jgi:hypothetical protein
VTGFNTQITLKKALQIIESPPYLVSGMGIHEMVFNLLKKEFML